MKNPKIDIYKTLLVNRMVVFALLIAFVAAAFFFSISIKNLYTKQLNTVLVLDSKGEVIPMKWADRLENIKIEVADHLERFHNYFYGYDAYNIDRQLEKALWYGDKSIEQLYIKRKNDGYYNKVKTYGIEQEIEIKPEDIQISGNDEPFTFRVKATLTIKQDEDYTFYTFETAGNIIFVSRNYPLNPHGLLITNFSEINRTQINQ